MQHSHESLDRPGGFSGGRLLSPLRHRDFRVLWTGMAVSLLGDGIFLIAIAWESYALWNTPAALSIVGIGMAVPTVLFLLAGGIVSDRYDRRLVMIWADGVRAVAVAVLAVLVLAGALRFWELVVLVAIYGSGTAFFTPAFEAVVPDLLPVEDLPAANSLDQFVRPIALRLAGPLLGGALVSVGAGLAFAVDAASFVASLVAVAAIKPRLPARDETNASALAAVKEGLRFIRQRVWLWGTLASAAIAYLVFLGPTEVLLPYVVKNELHASAGTLGFVFAAGGLGAVGSAVWMGSRGHPGRDITFIYGTWTLATLAVAGYGLATAAWQLMLACLVFNALETVGTIVWATVKQRHVPSSMLGRVSSLDWMISIGLLPVSFALTAPVAAAVGVRVTLVGAAVVGATVTLGALFLPGMRDLEKKGGEEPLRPLERPVPLASSRRA
ncbi:MAG TPA: MFS transporter [Gaiellaceae bacterium]|nr:MFS transporter [Gaiellaceae bacterium]